MSDRSIVVLYSGGTDSTLAAALAAEEFDRIHLVSYKRFGVSSIENSRINAKMLVDRYGEEKVSHSIIRIDRLFKFISYERYFYNLFKFGFQNLSTCGFCKLAMHMRTIKYCLDHNIKYVSDGANEGMSIFPAQMRPVLDDIRAMYRHFGISFFNPIFDYDAPEEQTLVNPSAVGSISPDILPRIVPVFDHRDEFLKRPKKGETAGDVLFRMGLAPAENIKGSSYDKKRQARCFQLILFNVFAIKYFLAANSYEKYTDETVTFFKEKIGTCINVLSNNGDKRFSRLFSER